MVPSVIAVNMILAAASGGVVAVLIASWAQVNNYIAMVNHMIYNYIRLDHKLNQSMLMK